MLGARGGIYETVAKSIEVGYSGSGEPFIREILKYLQEYILFELRTRSRVFIEKGRNMLGVTRFFPFVQYYPHYFLLTDFG